MLMTSGRDHGVQKVATGCSKGGEEPQNLDQHVTDMGKPVRPAAGRARTRPDSRRGVSWAAGGTETLCGDGGSLGPSPSAPLAAALLRAGRKRH